jgi:2-oxoisovalerate dehydrogenase E1 component
MSEKNKKENIELTDEQLLFALKQILYARNIDAKAMTLLKQGKTFFHIAGSGHEAIQVAAAMQLNPTVDWMFPYYRDLAFVLTSGMTLYEFFLHCYGKADDPASGGRQLPAHWGNNKINLPAQSSPTGTQFLQAAGAAMALKKKHINGVSYVSGGEGTTSQGEFHEAANWASREKLPVLFVIQNNKYAISVPVTSQTGGKEFSVAEMMAGYENLYRKHIDGTDFIESVSAVKEAIEYIKAGKGPALIEADVVRLMSHSSSDDQKKYRPAEELKTDIERDPLEKITAFMIKNKFITREKADEIKEDILNEINEAAGNALKAADPDPATAAKYVYDESGLKENLKYGIQQPAGNNIVMVDAINHALHEEMELNQNMYIFGEDIADNKGGVFTATKGLSSKFGNERVFNSPLAEASIMGVAIGMALAGLKPVVEIQFGDYIWPAFMQLKDELAPMRYRSNNNWASPVVIRTAVGGFIHGGLNHSQNIESIFAHLPGIYIAYPSNAADAKGLLKTACRMNDPVLFCEHKGLYRQSFATSPEPGKDFLLPFGKANVLREGSDVSVITYGAAVWDVMDAARRLNEENYSVEVIDLRTINPVDYEAIFNSVKKTNKAIIIHEDTLTAGFGAEISARIAENCFEHLDGPVRRVGALDAHVPYHPLLEDAVLPNRKVIYEAIKNMLLY